MRIAIYGRFLNDGDVPYIQQLFDTLDSRSLPYTIHESFLARIEKKLKLPKEIDTFTTHTDIAGKVDYMFSVGGDGTLLDTITLIRDSEIPIIGINVGRLGFLTSIGKEEIDQAVDAIERSTFVFDQRSLIHLESNIELFGEESFALNEMTIHKKDTSSMITIHTFLNGEHMNSYWADGLIVSTPTGSTGYSLSVGGPVVFPAANNFVIAPVAPHNLNVRPIIVPDDNVISFEIEGRNTNFLCTLDSRYKTIDSSFQLAVRKESFSVKLARLNDSNFLKTLRNKMMWGIDQRN
jgi:NAD+ kinase